MSNPPAFPTDLYNTEHQAWVQKEGMTLRDYFAAKAMQGLLADPDWRMDMDFDETAFAAYHQADEMLKAREQ
jgi:hypothetical protein